MYSRFKSPPGRHVALIVLSLIVTSCGPMKVLTTKYFSINGSENRNYYRLTVRGKSTLGKAEFRNGWFPEESVDMLFGNVSDSVETAYQKTKKDIKVKINDAVYDTYVAWLDSASKIDMSDEVLDKILAARRRVLAYPYGLPYPNTFEIEYNPAMGIAVKHADEKEVFILSSNPDEVVGKIASFAESNETAKSISQLANTVYAKETNDLRIEKKKAVKSDTLIKKQLNKTITALEGANVDDSDVQMNLRILQNLLK